MSLRKDILLSLIDQGLLSLVNLVVGISLIKILSKTNYGTYVVAYTVVLFIVGLQNAVITTQMTVLAPSKPESLRDAFCAALGVGQYLLYFLLAVVLTLLLVVMEHVGAITAETRNIGFATVIATAGVLWREYFRSYYFLNSRPAVVLVIDLAYVLALLIGLMVAWQLAPAHVHIVAVLLLGIASVVSILGAAGAERPKAVVSLYEARASLNEAWMHGRWALGGIILSLIQGQSFVYLLSVLASPAKIAEANAARMLFSPLSLLHMSVSRVLLPRWANLREEGMCREVISGARRVRAVLIGIIIVYMGTLFVLSHVAISVILRSDYTDIGTFILLWGVLSVVQTSRSSDAWLLQVFREFKRLTLANVLSASIAVILGAVLIRLYGPEGSVAAMIVAEVILVFSLAKVLRDVLHKHPN